MPAAQYAAATIARAEIHAGLATFFREMNMTPNDIFSYSIKTQVFDEHYQPASSTRLTTNFANLARGEKRRQNLRNTLQMINRRLNDLADWDNPKGERYSIELEIVSADLHIAGCDTPFPSIEMLNTAIIDHDKDRRIQGLVGNSFSSYIRDYDFSVLLLDYNKDKAQFSVPQGFGDLHGELFKYFLKSEVYQEYFKKPPVICLSVSTTKTYRKTANRHPILGVEYRQDQDSLTDQYFRKMGLEVRFFMPPKAAAPFAFYFGGDLLGDYSNLELIATIATMETFQKIYRPEIYNANAAAAAEYRASLQHQDHSLTTIDYDREERTQLAIKQGQYAQEHFIKPQQPLIAQWLQASA